MTNKRKPTEYEKLLRKEIMLHTILAAPEYNRNSIIHAIKTTLEKMEDQK